MATRQCRRGADSFALHSEANRDLGMFLVFSGLVASVPAYYLFRVFVMHTNVWDWRKGAAFGGILVLLGLALMAFTWRSFRVREGSVQVRDGMLRRPISYFWKEAPFIRLQAIEAMHGGRAMDMWQVLLVDGKYEYLLDLRPNGHLESRCLAEFLAKSIGCPLQIHSDEGELRVDAADLDLPFSERVQRYPAILGQKLERPDSCPVKEEREGEGRVFSWGLTTTGVLSDVVILFVAVIGLTMIPLPGSEKEIDYSLLELARLRGDYSFYLLSGGVFLAALFLLVGYRAQIRLTPREVTVRNILWGVPYRSEAIPMQRLEEISVRGRSQGSLLQLVSDDRIINLRIARRDFAAWLASELRYAVAGQEDRGGRTAPARS